MTSSMSSNSMVGRSGNFSHLASQRGSTRWERSVETAACLIGVTSQPSTKVGRLFLVLHRGARHRARGNEHGKIDDEGQYDLSIHRAPTGVRILAKFSADKSRLASPAFGHVAGPCPHRQKQASPRVSTITPAIEPTITAAPRAAMLTPACTSHSMRSNRSSAGRLVRSHCKVV